MAPGRAIRFNLFCGRPDKIRIFASIPVRTVHPGGPGASSRIGFRIIYRLAVVTTGTIIFVSFIICTFNTCKYAVINQQIISALSSTIVYIVIGYLVLLAIIYLLQERFIFKPEKLQQDFKYKYDAPFKELFFEVAQGVRINGLHFYVEKPLGLIIYFHGNSRSIKGWAKYAKDFYRYQYDVVLVDYRGFGKSTGKRSEKDMHSDMQFVYDTLTTTYHENHLIVYGRSLGSGFATNLASENKPRYLILEAPYFNFKNVVERFLPILPVRFVLRFHMRTDRWLPKVNCHTYILHGTKDWLIPISNSEKLQALNPKKITLIRIEGGGHNNLPTFPEYHKFIRDILAP